MLEKNQKSVLRKQLRDQLISINDVDRHQKSIAACSFLCSSPEFNAARVVMLFLSMQNEVETSCIAIKAWQQGKTVVVPKVSWDQRRMMPVEITSLTDNLTTTGPGVREPINGNPCPLAEIDLVVVPGLGFSPKGFRIGRGMGFYDRFLAQPEFLGVSCGLGFDEQIVSNLPVLDHDMPLAMLVTDRGIRRFATNCIEQR